MFSLLHPFFLLLLPLFVLLYRYRSKRSDQFYMPHIRWLKTTSVSTNPLELACLWGMVTLAIVALSDPVTIKEIASKKKHALDIVLALDTSGSMSMYGFNPKAYRQTRLDVVKDVVTSFIKSRKEDRLGLVVFGTHSTVASPLSFDTQAQQQIIQGLRIGALGKSTALVDALVSSIKLLKESRSTSKVIILLSDGEDSSSVAPLNVALKLAQKYHIKIYTILIDKTQSNMMKLIAKASHTPPFEARNKSDLKAIYRQIDKLEKSTLAYQTIKIPQHIYSYFLFASLLCALVLLYLRRGREVF